jgi:DNA polymerase IIIc chi subunit
MSTPVRLRTVKAREHRRHVDIAVNGDFRSGHHECAVCGHYPVRDGETCCDDAARAKVNRLRSEGWDLKAIRVLLGKPTRWKGPRR